MGVVCVGLSVLVGCEGLFLGEECHSGPSGSCVEGSFHIRRLAFPLWGQGTCRCTHAHTSSMSRGLSCNKETETETHRQLLKGLSVIFSLFDFSKNKKKWKGTELT